ncbi:MAG TPA: MtrB/PioB family decaheme-associated outer membrane protein [Usitatibacter sp.]|nr:MtrB/PioB family decaheme-associated outer membrane protein [Usitatibacter sp.]
MRTRACICILFALGMGARADEPAPPRDPRGIGALHDGPSRSPAGFMYDTPFTPPATTTGESGWTYHGALEAGVLGGDGDLANAIFREYRDFRNGFILEGFGLTAEKDSEARYLRLFGGKVGNDDQSYGLAYGRWNDYRVKLFVDDAPHVFATDARPIWNGVGTGSLTLPSGLTPGASTSAAIQAAVDSSGTSTLALKRRKGGVEIDKKLDDAWSLFARYTLEQREGTRPFGGSFFFPTPAILGASMETVEPIDYLTQDIAAGVRHESALRQLNLLASASVFRNRIDTLTWENPFNVTPVLSTPNAENIQRGRFDLYPDNEAYQLKADFAQSFPAFHRSRLTASVEATTMRQDDALIPPTVNTGTAGRGGFQFPLSDWNTPDALSRKNADAAIDLLTASLDYSFVPIDRLTLRAKARHEDSRNRTSYEAFNPLTGQFGYPALDGGRGTVAVTENGFYTPGGPNSQWHYRSIPFEHQRVDLGFTADYPLTRRMRLLGEYERQEFHREHRERDRTWEDKVRLTVTSRISEAANLRVALEHANRRGSEYHYDPYGEFFTASLPGYPDPSRELPHTLADLRKYDLSDRRQDGLNARLNLQLAESVDGFMSLRLVESDYPASYGRTGKDSRQSFNAEINYQPAPLLNAYAFYSYESARSHQASIRDSGIPGASGEAGGADYPLENAWRVEMRDRNDAAGFGVRCDFGKARLDVRYTYANARTPIRYEAASAGASSLPLDDPTGAFPDLTFRQHAAEANLVVPFTARLSARLLYRYEDTKVDDWHYTGLGANLLQGQWLYLDAGPQGYRANVFGVFLQYRM